MTQELNKFVLTDANLSEILNKVMPYIEELQLDNHNEPNAGILYDYKLEEALIGLRKILYYLENKSQQPIPQDINKWIEDEARKEEIYERKYGGKDHSGYDTKMLYEVNYERSECFEKGAKAMYQLLLPELQQLRDKVWALEGVAKHQESEIEQYKAELQQLREEIEKLKKQHDAGLKLAASNFREMLSAKTESYTKILTTEIEQQKETIVRLKEELAECQQTTKGVAEKGLEKIEQQKETIEELKKDRHEYYLQISSLKQENEKMRIALSRISMGQNGQLKGEFITMAQKLSREAISKP